MSTARTLITPKRVVAVAVTLVVALATITVWPNDAQGDVAGVFVDASPLEVGSEVRASGVKVGKVASIELDGKVARVALDIDDAVYPLHSDATMVIRPINLLGENFVELDPGSDDAPELDGDLPVEQTQTNVTLQSLLDTFDDPTSTGLAALISELGAGVDGSGAELGEAIKALSPAMDQINELGDLLRSQNDVLNRLIETADPVAAAVSGRDGERLDRLIEQARQTLLALATRRTGIEETLAELPSTLAEARQTLTSLDTVADSVTPTLRKARPITSDLEEIAGEISDFTVEATPAFAGFDEVFARADALLQQTAPIARALRETGPQLRSVGRGVRPLGDQVVNLALDDLMSFVRKWSLSTNGRDAVSHYFRGVVHVTPEALNSMLGTDLIPPVIGPSNGDGNSEPDEILPDLGNLLGPVDLGGTLGGVLDGLLGGANGGTGLVGGLLGKKRVSAEDDLRTSATGLTRTQEQSLLGQLLGGQS
jgi:phospholipid/cholesterol/gamma-HCH transport system substrate-binding protein